MLLKGYRKEFCRPPNPEAQHLRCVAYIDENIGEVLPYLNTVLKGHQYNQHPPSLTLKFDGKLITLYSNKIGINIVKDENEAGKILEWLEQEINDTWKKRREIKPSSEVAQKPVLLNILKLLPKMNCQECGQQTCMLFALMIAEGEKSPENCPQLDMQNNIALQDYLKQFIV